jgi:hypothetical protein
MKHLARMKVEDRKRVNSKKRLDLRLFFTLKHFNPDKQSDCLVETQWMHLKKDR